MATVTIARRLRDFFPALSEREFEVDAGSIAELVRAIDGHAPGFAHHVCSEGGALRAHINIFIDDALIADKRRLSDSVRPGSRVQFEQALAGG